MKNTQRIKLSDMMRLLGSNIGVIGHAAELLNWYRTDGRIKNKTTEIIAEMQQANHLIELYDPKAICERREMAQHPGQIWLFNKKTDALQTHPKHS